MMVMTAIMVLRMLLRYKNLKSRVIAGTKSAVVGQPVEHIALEIMVIVLFKVKSYDILELNDFVF